MSLERLNYGEGGCICLIQSSQFLHDCSGEVYELVVYFPNILSNTLFHVFPYLCKLPQSKSVDTLDFEYPYLIPLPQFWYFLYGHIL